jgi:PST family polysaccharide transporter
MFIIARIVGPGPVGDFAIALGASSVVGQLPEIGAAAGLIHRKHFSSATTWAHTQVQIISALFRLGLTVVVLPPVSMLFGPAVAELLLGLSLIQVIWALGATPRVLMEKRLDFKKIALIDSVALLLSSAGGIGAAALGWGPYALLIGGTEPALILYTAQAVGNLLIGPRQEKTGAVSIRELRWFFGFARGFWVQAQFVPIILHWDRLVVGFFLGPVSAGLYDIASRIATLPTRFAMQFVGRVMVPVYAQFQSDKQRIGQLLRTQLEAAGYLVTLFFVVFFAADRAGLIRSTLGSDWQSVGVMVLGLSAAGWLRVVIFTLWPAVIATGQTWALARSNMIWGGLMLVVVPILVFTNGVSGVLVGVTFATAASTAVLLRTMNPPWAGNPAKLPMVLLLPAIGLLLGFVVTLLLPYDDVWVAWLLATLFVTASLVRRRLAIVRLMVLVGGSR